MGISKMDGESKPVTETIPPDTERAQTATVYVGLPHCGMVAAGALASMTSPSLKVVCKIEDEGSSALTRNFNALLINARNSGCPFMAMHHADVVAPPGWVDTLFEELEKYSADIVSTVIPIKDYRGLTTTGVFSKDGTKLRRFVMKEVMSLPETFCAESAGYPGHALAINTGLWLMRMDRPWIEKLVFKFEDEIVRGEDGKLMGICRSEDWLFSEDLAKFGARVFATRKIPVKHIGSHAFGNEQAWGAWGVDQAGVGGFARWR